ncbi:MAG: exonuclease domain-containing protein [Sandaracinaceae bacterium]|nr:exonuclease domain-containing protein [Sandaracinaceae bacterium]
METDVNHYVVIDLEATTSSNGSLPKDEMETIEIGAVFVDASDLSVVGEFQTFIRPMQHPQLLPFYTELTTITQSMIDDAPIFPSALADLVRHIVTPFSTTRFCSWGLFDKTQFERDCAFHEIAYPLPEHINLKDQFSKTQGKRRTYAMSEALKICGVELDGTHHRGIDDARSITKLLPWIVGENRI